MLPLHHYRIPKHKIYLYYRINDIVTLNLDYTTMIMILFHDKNDTVLLISIEHKDNDNTPIKGEILNTVVEQLKMKYESKTLLLK